MCAVCLLRQEKKNNPYLCVQSVYSDKKKNNPHLCVQFVYLDKKKKTILICVCSLFTQTRKKTILICVCSLFTQTRKKTFLIMDVFSFPLLFYVFLDSVLLGKEETFPHNNNNNNNNNNNCIQRRCAANHLHHARSRGPSAIVCKWRTTHRALITCNTSCYVPGGMKGQLSY